MFKNRPAVKFSIPFIIGILIGWEILLNPITSLTLLLVALSLYGIIKSSDSLKYLAPSLLFLVILLCGNLKISLDLRSYDPYNIQNFVKSHPIKVNLQGVISGRGVLRGDRFNFLISAESLFVEEQAIEVNGDVLATILIKSSPSYFIDNYGYGRKVKVSGELMRISERRNPHEFDYQRYSILQNIYARLRITDSDSIWFGDKSGNWFLVEIVFPFREWIGKQFDRLVGGEESKLLKGLVIGERSEMSPEIKTAFLNSGLMHLLAVSGFNVALVSVIFWSVFSLFRIPEKLRAIFTVFGLIFFMYLTGSQPPVVRAVIMAIFILGARIFELKPDLYNIVALAAVLHLLVDAKVLFDVGFQLSFSAVLGLAYMYPKMIALQNLIPERFRSNVIFQYIFLSLGVSLAAIIGTLPLTAYYFQKVSIVGVLLNLIAVPLSGLILSVGFTIVAVTAFIEAVAVYYSATGYLLSNLLLTITTWAGNLPFAYISTDFSIFTVICTYGIIIGIFEFKRIIVRRVVIIGLLLIGNILLYISIFQARFEPLRVTFLDVGQGDAIFIEFPKRKTLLIDAGPRTFYYDVGERTIVPFLKSKGVNSLNAILVTHLHSDHIGGLPSIMRKVKIDKIIETGSFSSTQLVKEYRMLIDSLKILCDTVSRGEIIYDFDNVRLYVLHPSGDFLVRDSIETVNHNNQSIVIKLVYGNTSILFMGDAEEEVEEYLETIFREFLQSDILKVGHHGSNTSSSESFLKRVFPKIAVISVGKNNKFRHPSPEVEKRLAELSVQYFRTDQSGAVIIESDGKKWEVVNWR